MSCIRLTRLPIEKRRVHHSIPTVKAKATGLPGLAGDDDVQGGAQKQPDLIANDLLLQANEWGGYLAALGPEETEGARLVPKRDPMGEYLLVFDPLDDSPAIDVSTSGGAIFSVLTCPEGRLAPHVNAFLRPGRAQVAAGYVIYARSTMRASSGGTGTHGFTLDREFGRGVLTHTNIRIQPDARAFAIKAAQPRFRALPLAADGPRVAADHAAWQA